MLLKIELTFIHNPTIQHAPYARMLPHLETRLEALAVKPSKPAAIIYASHPQVTNKYRFFMSLTT